MYTGPREAGRRQLGWHVLAGRQVSYAQWPIRPFDWVCVALNQMMKPEAQKYASQTGW